jgi:SAM-dependent methyltransferase
MSDGNLASVAKDLSKTIEFFVPKEGLDLQFYLDKVLPPDAIPKAVRLRKQAIHHLGRYYWAAKVLSKCPPGSVLDVACGSGYGSSILAQALPGFSITGGDYDSRAVEHATKTYGGPENLAYAPVDVVTWRNPETGALLQNFDYIVSFDTIEHLLHREIALINFSERLNPEGLLLLSTPCGKQDDLLNPGWEHHKIEYSYRHLYNLMRRFFENVSIPDNGSLPELSFWTDVVNGQRQEYLLRGNPMACSKPVVISSDWPPKQ